MSLSHLSDTSTNASSFSVGHLPSEPTASDSSQSSLANRPGFIDRRAADKAHVVRGERRQFGSSHYGLSDDGRELALAIDQYKVNNHRRYLTCDEMLSVLRELGYSK